MHLISIEEGVEDFSIFCKTFDVRAVIAAVDQHGNADGYDKELYALAMLRALWNGDLGDDRQVKEAAICDFWECGLLNGFSKESFNEVFQEYFVYW